MNTVHPRDKPVWCWKCKKLIQGAYHYEGGRMDRPVHRPCRTMITSNRKAKRR